MSFKKPYDPEATIAKSLLDSLNKALRDCQESGIRQIVPVLTDNHLVSAQIVVDRIWCHKCDAPKVKL